MLYNLYCDESNHLNKSDGRYMTLGYINCPISMVKKYNRAIRDIKISHGLASDYEIKWTKVSNNKIGFFKELIDFFFERSDIFFRCIIADKDSLKLDQHNLSHDDWYYRMYYLLLSKKLDEKSEYNIYIDIKDTCSGLKVIKLKEVLNGSYYDFSSRMIQKLQQVHSHETNLMQLCDLFIGAIGYNNNGYASSKSKLEVIEHLKNKSGCSLDRRTPLSNEIFNLFVWRG
ncbi:MAG: DUF3800 domain-containing protein [Clostridiales bacterium]|nr:DUF3800 domain-containing protein [Clostridiales bacterium]